jgi:hypothetical protein
MSPKRGQLASKAYGMGPTMLPMLSNGSIFSDLSNLSGLGEDTVKSDKIKKIDKARPPSLERWCDDYDTIVGLAYSLDADCGIHRRTVSFAKGPPDVWNGVSPLAKAPCRVERQISMDSPRVMMEFSVTAPRMPTALGPRMTGVSCTIGADFERPPVFDAIDHTD